MYAEFSWLKATAQAILTSQRGRMSDRKRREDIQHQVKFLSGHSLRQVWDLVQQEIVRHHSKPLWNGRPKDYKGSPLDFIRENFGTWENGKWRPDEYTWDMVKRDEPLNRAYRNWARRAGVDIQISLFGSA